MIDLENYHEKFIQVRVQFAKEFDQQLLDQGLELSQFFDMITEARKVKEKNEKRHQ